MDWKYAKLLQNLGNAVEVVCGSEVRAPELVEALRVEGAAVLDAAGIAYVSSTDLAARASTLNDGDTDAWAGRAGGSSWQSVVRRTGSIETDYLNGEIVLLGRLYGVPTPVNRVIQRLAVRAARDGLQPGSVDPKTILATAKSSTLG